MLGTIVNTSAIVIGSLIGGYFRQGLNIKYQKALLGAIGLSATALGFAMFTYHLKDSLYPVLFIDSMALGTLLGTFLDLNEKFNRLIQNKSGNNLAQGLSTAILLFCIGTLSILGPVQSALYGNNTLLYTNATLDFITSIVLSCAYGFIIIWASLVLFIFQGSIFVVSLYLGQYISHDFFNELSIVGGLLIVSSGLSILELKDLKTMNMLPSLLVVPLLYALLKTFF